MLKRRNLPPLHPGEILREEARDLTISAAAQGLKMTRANLSQFVMVIVVSVRSWPLSCRKLLARLRSFG